MVNATNLSVSQALLQMVPYPVFFYSLKQKRNTGLAKYRPFSIPALGQIPYKARSNKPSHEGKVHVNQLIIQPESAIP